MGMAALAKLAADVKFFNTCTSVTTKPCDAVSCFGDLYSVMGMNTRLIWYYCYVTLQKPSFGKEKKVIL